MMDQEDDWADNDGSKMTMLYGEGKSVDHSEARGRGKWRSWCSTVKTWTGESACRLQRELNHNGLLCVALASLVFSFSALLVKLTDNRVPVLEITLFRSGTSWLVGMGYLKSLTSHPPFGLRKSLVALMLRGLFGALAMTTYYFSLMMLPLADAVTLFFCNPVFTVALAWLIRGEALGWSGLAGCLASLAGVVLVSHPPFLFGGHQSWGPTRLQGTLIALASSTFCAAAFVTIRHIGSSEPALVVAMYFHSATIVLSIIPMALGFPDKAIWPALGDLLLLAGIAATSFVGQLFITRGFQLEAASRAAAVNVTQVIYSYLLGLIFLSQSISWMGVLGSLLVASGVLLVNWGKAQKPKDGPQEGKAQEEATASEVQLLLSPQPREQDSPHDADSSATIPSVVEMVKGLTYIGIPEGTGVDIEACAMDQQPLVARSQACPAREEDQVGAVPETAPCLEPGEGGSHTA